MTPTLLYTANRIFKHPFDHVIRVLNINVLAGQQPFSSFLFGLQTRKLE